MAQRAEQDPGEPVLIHEGNRGVDRRTALSIGLASLLVVGGGAAGGLAALAAPGVKRWAGERLNDMAGGATDKDKSGPYPKYIDLRFTERPEFRQEHAEVFHFDGDPRAKGKSREERPTIAVIGIPADQAKRQFTDRGYQPAAVYWSGDTARMAPLGSLANLGVLEVPEDPLRQGKSIEILAFGATVGEGDLHLSMAALGENGALVPVRGLRTDGLYAADLLAEPQHNQIPVI